VVLVSAVLAVVCGAFFFASGWIASAIYHESSLTGVFRFSALLVLFLSLFNLALSAVAGLQNFKAYSKAMVIRSGGVLVLAWAGVWLFGLYGALAGQLLACVFGVAYLTGVSIKDLRERFPGMVRAAFSRDILGELFSFSFPAFLAGILVAPAYWWANTLLARHAGFAQVGLFGVAFALCQLILVVPNSLSIPAISFMSETHASSELGRFSALVGANLRLVWALTLPISLACALFAPWIVTLLFGAKYCGAIPLVFIMSFVGLLMSINSVIGNAIAASGKMWHGFGFNGLWFAIFILSSELLIPQGGGWGLAMSFVGSYLALSTVAWFYVRRFLKISYYRMRAMVFLSLSSVGIGILASLSSSTAFRYTIEPMALVGLLVFETKYVFSEREKSLFLHFLRSLSAYNTTF
jgi:O-antigen/teichoic acid export membrane protein